MAQVTSAHIWYPNGYPGTSYDLRDAFAWYPDASDATKCTVRFISSNVSTIVSVDLAAFEAAKQASINAGDGV